MVEEMKCACIRVHSCTNEWMDCIFLVEEKDKEMSVRVLEKAWDDLWEDGEECYGDLMETKLTEASIKFDVYYARIGTDEF